MRTIDSDGIVLDRIDEQTGSEWSACWRYDETLECFMFEICSMTFHGCIYSVLGSCQNLHDTTYSEVSYVVMVHGVTVRGISLCSSRLIDWSRMKFFVYVF